MWYLNKYNGKKLSFIEKYANFVLDYHKYQLTFNSKNHLLINFEKFISNPNTYIKFLEKKFGKKTKITKKLLETFNLPRKKIDLNIERDEEKVYNLINDINTKKINFIRLVKISKIIFISFYYKNKKNNQKKTNILSSAKNERD